MRTRKALKHFGGKAKIAEKLGISRQAVYKWGDVVPAESAIILERLTEGKLKVIPSLYNKQTTGNSEPRTPMG